ncbi:MAG: hypothetical protein DRP18_00710 [Candidatus Aenigmatarchaeota archaeon]|nr:MAG: hypothetical protein DRP18_00710 [Candidatus Aenigmarchaeota archaeon]
MLLIIIMGRWSSWLGRCLHTAEIGSSKQTSFFQEKAGAIVWKDALKERQSKVQLHFADASFASTKNGEAKHESICL